MTHKKSFEVIEKYSMEIKTLRNKLNSGVKLTIQNIESRNTQTETIANTRPTVSDENLKELHRTLVLGQHSGSQPSTVSNTGQTLVEDIQSHVMTLKQERDQLVDNLKHMTETKTKLEVRWWTYNK